MGRREQDVEPLFEDMDGPYLVGLGNWLARSLDVSELGNEQVLLLHMVLERGLNMLWQAFPEVIAPLVMRMMASLDDDDDE
jgi:hypothetical protein